MVVGGGGGRGRVVWIQVLGDCGYIVLRGGVKSEEEQQWSEEYGCLGGS